MATQAALDLLEVTVPDLGDIHDVPVIEVLAKVGDTVAVDQTLVVIETEKATMDVPSTTAGIVREVIVKLGDKINCGSLLILVEHAAAAPAAAPAKPALVSAPAPVPSPAAAPAASAAAAPLKPAVLEIVPAPGRPVAAEPQPAEPTAPAGMLPHASPSVRRFAREFGLDLFRIHGTGPKGRILHTDLQAFVKQAMAQQAASPAAAGTGTGLDLLPWPQVDYAKFGPIERAELSKIKKISGANLTRNAILIPHVTNFDEVDITDLEDFRVAANKEDGGKAAKLTMLAFLIKASVAALKEHPTFNASLDGDHLILKHYFHIGFAADTPNGLVVPVIRDADTKGLRAIAAEMSSLAEQARAGKLKPADMQGGTFTVSSLGGIGGTGFTPIINAPEVAILGGAKAAMKPVWDGKQFASRLILPLSMSWDHRVIDGAVAARFLVTLTRLLSDFRRVML